ncbi:MAG TPA: hypothetical protein VK403_02340 [Allosphingosinicella sp.]|nr:hypothetical protein [Allosphingosinicella sp.]
MAQLPSKLVRFLVWASGNDHKDDALTALVESYVEVTEKFGSSYAMWWSFGQGLRALPYGFIGLILKVGSFIFRIGK